MYGYWTFSPCELISRPVKTYTGKPLNNEKRKRNIEALYAYVYEIIKYCNSFKRCLNCGLCVFLLNIWQFWYLSVFKDNH